METSQTRMTFRGRDPTQQSLKIHSRYLGLSIAFCRLANRVAATRHRLTEGKRICNKSEFSKCFISLSHGGSRAKGVGAGFF